MRLPNAIRARVERGKIEKYLLCHDHPDGAPKAQFFERFGFHHSDWHALASALKEHGQNHPVTKVVETGYGTRYIIDGPMRVPDGRAPSVRTVWITEPAASGPRLITAHPIGEWR
jgi:hypothetical protein